MQRYNKILIYANNFKKKCKKFSFSYFSGDFCPNINESGHKFQKTYFRKPVLTRSSLAHIRARIIKFGMLHIPTHIYAYTKKCPTFTSQTPHYIIEQKKSYTVIETSFVGILSSTLSASPPFVERKAIQDAISSASIPPLTSTHISLSSS